MQLSTNSERVGGAAHDIDSDATSAASIFSCTDLSNFISSIVQILPFQGFSNSRFYLCELNNIRFLTKVCMYTKVASELYGRSSPNVLPHTDAEIAILQILKKRIIDMNISPCILELVYSQICTGIGHLRPPDKVCEQLMVEYLPRRPNEDVQQLFCKYYDEIRNDLAHDKVAFLVLEKCDMTLDEYLKRSINTPVSLAVFKSLLFLIIYTFFVIRRIFPQFHHYDLHTDNIMLKFDPNYKFKATDPKFLVFHIDGVVTSVPYFGIVPKIIDFGFSSIPEEGIISNVKDDKRRMYDRSNNDLLFLFHWINYELVHIGGDKLGRVDKILSALEPNRAYVHYYNEYIRKIEANIPTYEDMVKNKIFDEYRKFTAPASQIYDEYRPVNMPA